MKIFINLIKVCFLGIILFLFGCGDDIKYESSFNKSYKTWITFKNMNEDSYIYTVVGNSWVGISWETSVMVVKGLVVKRSFKYTSLPSFAYSKEIEKEWVENQNEINKHNNSPAFEAITIDEIYRRAKSEWLIKDKDKQIIFETKNSGLISTCGYIINNCVDDCFVGVVINNIEGLLGVSDELCHG